MALTPFQRRICRLIAENRIRSGEGYVAVGVALNTVTAAQRISQDIDLFHDTEAALDAPDATLLAQQWHRLLAEARDIVAALPPESAGMCVLEAAGELCRAPAPDLPGLVARNALLFHEGRIRGTLPRLR